MNSLLLLPLLAAISPFFLLLIEIIFPYPHIVEELAKALIILVARYEGWKTHEGASQKEIQIIILSGILFALSETVLYLFNIYLVGDLSLLLLRLILTAFLHVLTFLIIFILMKKSFVLAVLGVLIAILIHFAFNIGIRLIQT